MEGIFSILDPYYALYLIKTEIILLKTGIIMANSVIITNSIIIVITIIMVNASVIYLKSIY